jgi:surfeit locus 1 family protein
MTMKQPFRVTLAGVLGTLGVLAVAAICARLGVWQLDRLEERVARNEVIATRLALPDLGGEAVVGDSSGVVYRVAEVVGEYDAAHGIVLAGRSHQSTAGVHLLLPLRLSDGNAVLVHRGWLPALDAGTVDPASFTEAGPVRLRGILLPFPDLGRSAAVEAGAFRRLWYRLDGEAFGRQSPYPLSGLYLQLLPDDQATGYPLALPPPVLDDGPHLGYAIQWFSSGLIALVGWVVLLLRREGRGSDRRLGGRPGRGHPSGTSGFSPRHPGPPVAQGAPGTDVGRAGTGVGRGGSGG